MATSPTDRLLNALETGGCGMALFDPEDRLRYANPSFTSIFGVSAEQAPTWEAMLRACHRDRRGVQIETDDIDAWIARTRLNYRSQPLRCFESDLVDGRWLWVTETLQPDGWLLVHCSDITPLKVNEASLRKAHDAAVVASLTDPLTELYNRRFIFRRLHDLLTSSRELRYPLCVSLIDIDHFKLINDRQGHSTGDRVLRRFASQLKGQMRPLDAIGRIGGEEFLLLMPNVSLAGAEALLARLRMLMLEEFSRPGDAPGCTFSAGVTCAVADDSVDSLVSRADRALYVAKSSGRDRHVAMPADVDAAADPVSGFVDQ